MEPTFLLITGPDPAVIAYLLFFTGRVLICDSFR